MGQFDMENRWPHIALYDTILQQVGSQVGCEKWTINIATIQIFPV